MLTRIRPRFLRAVQNEKGVLAIEYALLVAFIGLVVIAGITLLGSNLNTWYTNVATFVGTLATSS